MHGYFASSGLGDVLVCHDRYALTLALSFVKQNAQDA